MLVPYGRHIIEICGRNLQEAIHDRTVFRKLYNDQGPLIQMFF